jgi:hypothetical protein
MVAQSMALDPSTLKPFVDPLQLPAVMKNSGMRPDPEDAAKSVPFYRVAMEEIHQKVHRDLPPTRMWGFNGSSPGPIFETRSGHGLMVEWANQLPVKHFLPIDHTLHGAEADKPEVRCVIHLHGGRTPAASDGYPEDWVVPGKSLVYHYPNKQDAALLFYHDHTMGINRLNIYAGLQGMFFIRDDALRPFFAVRWAAGVSGLQRSEVAVGSRGVQQRDAGEWETFSIPRRGAAQVQISRNERIECAFLSTLFRRPAGAACNRWRPGSAAGAG